MARSPKERPRSEREGFRMKVRPWVGMRTQKTRPVSHARGRKRRMGGRGGREEGRIRALKRKRRIPGPELGVLIRNRVRDCAPRKRGTTWGTAPAQVTSGPLREQRRRDPLPQAHTFDKEPAFPFSKTPSGIDCRVVPGLQGLSTSSQRIDSGSSAVSRVSQQGLHGPFMAPEPPVYADTQGSRHVRKTARSGGRDAQSKEGSTPSGVAFFHQQTRR